MTTKVVTVDRITPYQDIDRLLTRHRISGVPVLKIGREVVGVVSETDLMARRGWTSFGAGKFQTGAYSFDVSKSGVLGSRDTLGLRLAQPLRVVEPDRLLPS